MINHAEDDDILLQATLSFPFLIGGLKIFLQVLKPQSPPKFTIMRQKVFPQDAYFCKCLLHGVFFFIAQNDHNKISYYQ